MKAIIDFDTPVFTACLAGQGDVFEITEDFDVDIDYDLIKSYIDTSIKDILFETGSDDFSLHLTGEGNFRYRILPSYKWRRKNLTRPEALKWAKQYCVDTYKDKVIMDDDVEADDTAIQDFTNDEDVDKILCHVDKDLDQINGLHYDYNKQKVYNVSEEEADINLWTQVLKGDTADCYKGCPQVGGDKTNKILTSNLTVRPYIHTFKRGKKAGMSEIRWEEYHDSTMSRLDRIKSYYIKGYYTKGGQGHVLGFKTTSGFEDDVKIKIENVNGMCYISKQDIKFVEKEIEIQYTIARMLRYGDSIPTEPIKLF
jgi:hypothetical protein